MSEPTAEGDRADGAGVDANASAGADGVIRLVTATEREAEAEAEFNDHVLEEALGMLGHAAEILKEHGVGGLAIAFVLKDGSYGRILPMITANVAGLIGSIATMQQDLILRTLEGDGDE